MVMKTKKAISVLKDHNTWRRSTEDYYEPMPHDPATVGVALDIAIVELESRLHVSEVVALVDSMSEFDTEEERELYLKDLETNLAAL